MIDFSIIRKSQLEGAHRLDAEYYQPEYFIDFTKGKWKSIGTILEVCQYGISKAMNEEGIGYPIYRMDDIKDAFLVDEDLKFANITETEAKVYKLEKNDVLFNRVNSEEFVGRTGIFKLPNFHVFASYLIRLRVQQNSGVAADYLNIFLNSEYGIRQIRKFRRRAVNQANVNAEELKKIQIALISESEQRAVEILSNQSWEQYERAKKLYQQAESLLLEELGLKDNSIRDDLSFVVKLSDVTEAHRADAEYFQPKYQQIRKIIEKQRHEKLFNVCENVPAQFLPDNEKAYRYVELADINASIGVIDGCSEILGKEAPSRARRILKGGDVIASSVEGSLEKVALVNSGQKDFLASTGFFQFRAKTMTPEVLLVMAKSPVLQMQLQQRTTGTILSAVSEKSLEDVIVPTLPSPASEKITNLVRQSHEARKKAKELLEEAKKKVEKMIEKGGG